MPTATGPLAGRWTRSRKCTGIYAGAMPDVVDADLSKYFDTIPHSELIKSVARRVVDRNVLRLIKMWLRAPIEERDADETRRMSGGKRNTRGTPQGGVASPLLANIYMNRFLKHWRLTGCGDTFQAHVVSICRRLRYPQPRSRGGGISVDEGGDDQARVDDQRGENFAEKRPTGTLRLPSATRSAHIGLRRTGNGTWGASPSKKSVQRSLRQGSAIFWCRATPIHGRKYVTS